MSSRKFEIAQQYLMQTKYEALKAIASLQAAATSWSDYDLSLEEEAELNQQLQLNLQEIQNAIENRLSPSRGFLSSRSQSETIETNITAEIPPFDPDEDF